MNLEDDEQLANTQRKLTSLEQQIELAKSCPQNDTNAASLRSLVQTANQLREEIIRYRSQQKRRAS